MTTYKYGSYVGAQQSGKITHRAWLGYDVSTNNDTTYALTVSSGVDPWNTTWNAVHVNFTMTGQTAITGRSITQSTGNLYTAYSGKSYSYTKGHSAVTYTISSTSVTTSVSSSAGGAAVNGKVSTASFSFTVPAKTSYAVSFNANGGSGAPANQTKWYGEALTLSSAVPSKENYTFKGWATTEARATAGTVDYAAGGTVAAGTNSALTLWAVWEHIYIAPIMSTLKVRRTATNSSSTEDIEGNYLYLYFYYVGGHFAGESYMTPTCSIKIDGNALTPAPTLSGSGTVEEWYSVAAYSTSVSHTLEIKLTDSEGDLTVIETIPSTKYPIELEPDGSMMALGVPTRFKQDVYIDIDTNAAAGTVDGDLYAAIQALGWESDVIV